LSEKIEANIINELAINWQNFTQGTPTQVCFYNTAVACLA